MKTWEEDFKDKAPTEYCPSCWEYIVSFLFVIVIYLVALFLKLRSLHCNDPKGLCLPISLLLEDGPCNHFQPQCIPVLGSLIAYTNSIQVAVVIIVRQHQFLYRIFRQPSCYRIPSAERSPASPPGFRHKRLFYGLWGWTSKLAPFFSLGPSLETAASWARGFSCCQSSRNEGPLITHWGFAISYPAELTSTPCPKPARSSPGTCNIQPVLKRPTTSYYVS